MAFLRALIPITLQSVAMRNSEHWFPPRQIIITTHSRLVRDILGFVVPNKRRTGWQKANLPVKGGQMPACYRLLGWMDHWMQRLEQLGIVVQIWWTDEEVNGKAKEMADGAIQKQEKYVEKLYTLLRSFCEYAAEELGRINMSRTRRKRKFEATEED
jgi:hypothetical protein